MLEYPHMPCVENLSLLYVFCDSKLDSSEKIISGNEVLQGFYVVCIYANNTSLIVAVSVVTLLSVKNHLFYRPNI